MILSIFHYTNIPEKVECSQKNEGIYLFKYKSPELDSETIYII
jgi:hypothetical protein